MSFIESFSYAQKNYDAILKAVRVLSEEVMAATNDRVEVRLHPLGRGYTLLAAKAESGEYDDNANHGPTGIYAGSIFELGTLENEIVFVRYDGDGDERNVWAETTIDDYLERVTASPSASLVQAVTKMHRWIDEICDVEDDL